MCGALVVPGPGEGGGGAPLRRANAPDEVERDVHPTVVIVNIYWAGQLKEGKGCRQTLDCYCVSCELLSSSIADAL